MKKILYYTFISMLLIGNIAQAQDAYRISFKNNTPQLLTSAVCAVHEKSVSIFETGFPASSGLASLAEDGGTGAYVSELRALDGVSQVVTGNFVGAGKRSRLNVTASKKERISCVYGMLVVTNDGFPAMRGVKLPRKKKKSRRFQARAYDAGSEINTESCDHIPGGPCDAHFVGEAENGTVELHPGLQGIADIDVASFGWKEPAVRGRIRRIK